MRYFISRLLNKSMFHMPLGTLLVNLLGSFLLGWMLGKNVSETSLILLGTGFLGAFTTFSTLNWEMLQFQQQKQWLKAVIYLGISYTCGLCFAFIGYGLGLGTPHA